MTKKTNWQSLLEKFTNNTCSKEEYNQLLELIEQGPDSGGLTEELRRRWEIGRKETKKSGIDWEDKFSSLLNETREQPAVIPLHTNKIKVRTMTWAAAASVLLVFSVGGYFFFNNKNDKLVEKGQAVLTPVHPDEVPPGGNKAILTLADGSTINLDSVKNGTLATQGNIKIIKGEDGELLYYADKENSTVTGNNTYNTISIPKSGKYEIILSDGTKVWLNAASSLKFPASLNGETREVTLTGEGYFEVAPLAAKGGKGKVPFIVSIAGRKRGMTVEVLGTHFNVNAYNDESSVATTLLEGSVRVKKEPSANSASQTLMLVPGKQAVLKEDGGLEINQNANIQEAVAWKANNFEFNNTTLTSIMRQVSRWYDVEMEYRGSVKDRRFTGKISRDVNLNQLIDMLKYTGVSMKIENKKVIIWEN